MPGPSNNLSHPLHQLNNNHSIASPLSNTPLHSSVQPYLFSNNQFMQQSPQQNYNSNNNSNNQSYNHKNY